MVGGNHRRIKMTTEKQDLRVKINKETQELLSAWCELSGLTKGQVISDLIWGNIPSRLACARVFLTKYHNNIIYSTPNTEEVKTKKKAKTTIPDDFSPNKQIAEKQGMDYEGSLEVFVDWAKASAFKYACWNSGFSTACRGWIKKEHPHLRRVTSSQTTKGLRFD
jgi:hypothetical protein